MSKQNFFLLSVLVLTFVVLIPTLRNGWITLDDPIYILDNPLIKDLSWESIKLMFTTLQVNGSYNPIVLLSWAIDYHFVGLNPGLFHFTNLILHLLVVLLVFFLSLKLSNNKLVAFGTSLLFGIHPMHVEAVAWVTARKDLLYTLFYFSGLIAYFFYQEELKETKKRKWILVCFICFVLALFSKGSALTFPLILWAMDYLKKRKDLKILLLEKIPFLALSVFFAYLSIRAQDEGEALQFREFYSIMDSLSVGFFGYLDYMIKVFYPYKLSALHPYPTPSGVPVPWYFTAAALPVLAITIYCITKIKSNRKLVFGMGFFFISLIPVIQVLSFAISVTADRFTYLPYFGIFFIIACQIVQLIENKHYLKNVTIGFSTLFLIIMSFMTFSYSYTWKNSNTVWSRVIKFYPDYFVAYVNRAFYWVENGYTQKAIEDCNKAILLKPDYYLAYYNKGYAYEVLGDNLKAIKGYSQAIIRKEDFFQAYQNRGVLYAKLNKLDAASKDFETSINLKPKSALAFLNRATLFERKHNYHKAISDASIAILLAPKLNKAYYLRAKCYYNLNKKNKSLSDFSRVIVNDPTMVLAYMKRGVILFESNKFQEALMDFDKVIDLNNEHVEAYLYCSQIMIDQSKFDKALYYLNGAESSQPENEIIHWHRGVIYQKLGDYKTALKVIENGLILHPNSKYLMKEKENMKKYKQSI